VRRRLYAALPRPRVARQQLVLPTPSGLPLLRICALDPGVAIFQTLTDTHGLHLFIGAGGAELFHAIALAVDKVTSKRALIGKKLKEIKEQLSALLALRPKAGSGAGRSLEENIGKKRKQKRKLKKVRL
jgi:hypothetical protein